MVYHPVDKERYDVAAFDRGQSYIGTEWADKVEDFGRNIVSGLQRASQDQEGWHDDILRGAGSVLQGAGAVMNAPGIKQAMQVLDAGSYYGGKLGGHLAKSIGVDPRIGGLAGNLVGDAVTGGFVRKAPKIAGRLSNEAAEFALKKMPAQEVFAYSDDIPNFGNKAKFTRLSKKVGGSPEAIEQAKGAIQEATEYFNKHGNLRGRPQGNYWTHPETGKKYLIKNKTARGAAPNINMDDVESITKTRMQREAGAKLNTDEIKKIGKELDWDDKKVADYIKYANNEKKTLKALIRDLNKKEGKTSWSLGHRDAVKHQVKGNADRPKNIELEPLANFYDSKGNLIKGNAARAANDELSQVLSRMTDTTQDIYEDMLHWSDNDLGSFWPRMGPVTDVESFVRESEKRQKFIEAVQKLAKKEGISELEAGHDVLQKMKIMDQPLGKEARFPSIRSYSKK